MNRSGISVYNFSKYFKIKPKEILVVHDELDFTAGVIKLKTGGGTGGHNGLEDIAKYLKTKAFHRLRIGIDHPGSAN